MPKVELAGPSSLLFESLLVANAIGSQMNAHKDGIAFRHRSFSQSYAVNTVTEKTIKCPYCDKMFYKKYNLKSHLVSHSSKFTVLICRGKAICVSSL
jgi:uncharacterized C2H2 Zn-finger protein